MKRIFPLILLILLLCGCAVQPPEETTTMPPETTLEWTEPTEPAGIYVPFSDLEIQTDSSVRLYLPEDVTCYGIRMMEDDVLVFSGAESTILTRYAGEQLFPVASTELSCRVAADDRSFQISANGITYYNPETREVVFLDNDLKEVRRLEMSGDMVGKPVLSANRMQIYYCTAGEIRVYDTTTGLDKLLKTISYPQQSVEDILVNDSVLRCALVDDRGQESSIFVSTQTGELIAQISSRVDVATCGDVFYAKSPEGVQELLIFGRTGEDPTVLTPADPFARSWFLGKNHSLLTATVTQDSTRLDCYDLSSGLRTATVELPGGIRPQFAEVQPNSGEILLMTYDERVAAPVILRWNRDVNPAQDERVYTGPRYTPENPDVAGLDACAALAETISREHGIKVLIAWDAIAHQPWDYTLEPEYQTAVIRKQLENLDAALNHFPEGFFEKFSHEVSVCLVRSVRGNAESGSVEAARGIQFWDGYEPYVVLAAGDTLEAAFYHEMFHVMDSKVLSNTRVYYHWENLNPDGFAYYGDYTTYLEADASKYLQDEDRVFIDAYSMCFSREDRARIMEYACQKGNESYFQSETMQLKLKKLCEGIRQAFGFKNYQESFLWEQYLAEPLDIK